MKQIATRLTALLLALVMTTTLALAANKSGYSDVPDKNWASQSIAQCKQYNLLQGIGGGKFGLGQKMTRAAYAAALCRLMGWQMLTPEKGNYTDNQDAKKWYYSAIETASAHDVFSGHSTTCRPNDPITREEMAAMTVRALGYSTLSGTVQDECPFTDVSTNPGYITLAWRMGLVVGMNLTTFAPKSDTTREQAAAVLLRAYNGLKAKVSVTSVSAAPSGAVPVESLTGARGGGAGLRRGGQGRQGRQRGHQRRPRGAEREKRQGGRAARTDAGRAERVFERQRRAESALGPLRQLVPSL